MGRGLGDVGRGSAELVVELAGGRLVGVALVNWGVLVAIDDDDNVLVHNGHLAMLAGPVITADQRFENIVVEVRFTRVGADDREDPFPELKVIVVGAHVVCVGGAQ